MNEMKEYNIEKAFDTICKLENRLNEMEKDIATLNGDEYKLDALKELINERFGFLQRAVDKAEKELNYRLMGMNEFRDQLKDQTKTFITYDIYNANHKTFEIRIEAMQKIVWGGLAIVSFLLFAVPLLMQFLNTR